jgi:hypothetical protein
MKQLIQEESKIIKGIILTDHFYDVILNISTKVMLITGRKKLEQLKVLKIYLHTIIYKFY